MRSKSEEILFHLLVSKLLKPVVIFCRSKFESKIGMCAQDRNAITVTA